MIDTNFKVIWVMSVIMSDRGRYMAIMIWSDDFSVGVDKLDSDHIVLFSLINYLNDARIEGQDDKVIQPILKALINYADTHFRREEGLMKGADYDTTQYEMHLEKHQQFNLKVADMFKAFTDAGGTGMGEDLGEFLSEWLVNHILDVDMRYKDALKKKWGDAVS